MRKFLFNLVPLAAGVFGFALRRTELTLAFDEASLPIPGAGITYGLAALSFVVAVGLLLMSRQTGTETDYGKAFRARGGSAPLQFILGLALIAGAVIQILTGETNGDPSLFEPLFAMFAAFAGVSVLVLAWSSFRGRSGNGTCVCATVLVMFLCFWLIIAYKGRAADPVLLDYVYEFLAICSTVLAFYYYAGYAYGKAKPKKTVYFSQLGVYLCVTALADERGIGLRIFLGVFAALMFINSYLLIANSENSHPRRSASAPEDGLEEV